MQRARPNLACDCVSETAQIAHRIQRAANGPKHKGPGTASAGIQMPATTIALDDVLSEGRAIICIWERINGCANAAFHVDSDHPTLQVIIGAVDNLVGLYEMLGKAANLFATNNRPQGKDSWNNLPQERSSYTSDVWTPNTNKGAISDHDVGQLAPPAAYLGTHRLDDEEAVLVAREAVRHSVILLGELLHDIERDFGEELVESHCQDADAANTFEAVSKVLARLLRLLGQINSSLERT